MLTLAPERLAWTGGGVAAQLHLNPTDDVRSLGAGVALAAGLVQLSTGALWMRHEVLAEGLRVGDVLAQETDLRTRETYGAPRWFIGLSLVGMPPFLR